VHRFIEQEYGLKVEKMERLGRYDTFMAFRERYMIVPADNRTEAELSELQQMAAYLAAKGDLSAASLVPTTKGTWTAADERGRRYVVVRIHSHLYTRTI
jgi:hypothetical protein